MSRAAYGMYDGMKSHTGGTILLGHRTIMCKLTKQKMNTKSSPEAALVGATYYLLNTIWARMFFEAQDTHFSRITRVQ